MTIEQIKNIMRESAIPLAALKQHIALLEGHAHARVDRLFTFGVEAIDVKLGGGLAQGRLHELVTDTWENGASAAGFALMLAMRAAPAGLPLLWLRQDADEKGGRLHAPGLAEIGLDPARLILAVAPDSRTLFKAAGDSLRCAGLGAVVIEPGRDGHRNHLTISRRLALAAEQSGVTPFLLCIDAAHEPSAAQTRWNVKAAPSTALPANAPGLPAIDILLLRHRGGPDGLAWRVEWNRDQLSFREAPLSGAVLPFSADRSPAADRHAA